MALAVDFSHKTLVIVTGASQGIGRTIAVELSKRLVPKSKIILIARSESGLNATKELIVAVNKEIAVQTISLDLTKPTMQECSQILGQECDVEQAIVFHNAGQVGKLSNCVSLTDIQAWRDYYDLNVFSVGVLNSVLVTKLKEKVKRLYIINITSLCGREPFHGMSMYGSGKAARELYFRVFALEEKDVVVLNYSPGPVDTPMVDEIIDSEIELRKEFVTLKETKQILSPLQTVDRLLSILKSDYEREMENSLMFLIKLAWELKYRIPCLIAVSFLLLDIRMRLDVEVHVRRMQIPQPTHPSRRRERADENQEDDSDSWVTVDDDEHD